MLPHMSTEMRDLTVREVMARTGAAKPTVTLWCRQGKLPNARREQTPFGEVWMIPEGDLQLIKTRAKSPTTGRRRKD
jgi:hypothetical protein